jgi:RNA polymerase sigma factor (sigma-70 family)
MQCRYDRHNPHTGPSLNPNVVSYNLVPASSANTSEFPQFASVVASTVRGETLEIRAGESSSQTKFHAGHFPSLSLGRSKVIRPRDSETTDVTDEQLFHEYINGDELAFNTLHSRYRSMLRRYAHQKTGADASACDDIVQQVFLRVVRNQGDFIEGKLVRPWLFTITDRLCKDFAKGSTRRAKHVQPFTDCDLLRAGNERDALDDQPSDTILVDRKHVPVEERVSDAEAGRKAIRLLKQLPRGLRNAVELLVLGKLPSRAAGPLLKVSHMQAQNRRNMALDILRKQMETEQLDDCESAYVETGVLSDLIEEMTEHDVTAMYRAINEEASAEDYHVLAVFLRRLVGETVS